MSSTSSSSPTSSYTIPVITSYVHLGSLPTVTTLPPDCLTNALDFQVDGLGLPYTYFTVGCALSSCCPSGNFYSSAFQWYSEYYSPAVCPSGYVSIAADPIISTMAGETVRFCCPSDYISGGSALAYPNPATLTEPYYNANCQNWDLVYPVVTVYDNLVDQEIVSTVEASSLGRWYLIAYPIQIRWRDGDFNNEATPTSTTSTGVSSTRRPTSSSTTKLQGSHGSNGLDAGAIAGISVGLVLFAIGVIALVFFQRRRRAAPRKLDVAERRSQTIKYKSYELEQSLPQQATVEQPHELFATPELEGTAAHER